MASKELLLWCVVLVCVCGLTKALEKAPIVQVYSRYPISIGEKNILHCFTEDFHPPKINITLLKNNVKIQDVMYSDLSFKEDWTFQLLAHVPVVPNKKDEFSCMVEHQALSVPLTVKWEQDY